MISVCGIAIATMAMVCTLSIFNGFTKLVSDSFSIMDPDLQITPTKGKAFDASSQVFQQIKTLPEIDLISETVEDNALVKYGERQDPVLIKGVSDEFRKIVDTKRLITSGEFALREGDVDFCAAGIGVAIKLGLIINNITPIEIYSPKRDVKIQLANPANAFTTAYVYPSGVFALNQAKYDDQVILVSLKLARELFRYTNEVTSLDIKLKDNASVSTAQSKIQNILGKDYIVKDRFEQQAESFRMVNIEKWVTFLILSFILVIAVFNVVSSLSMLILDKTADIEILRNMGASNTLITRIFKIEGWLISMTGTTIGIVIGLALCLAQQHFGILKLGQNPDAFIVDAYPVQVMITDILFVFLTVSIIGGLIVLYPVNSLKKRLTSL